jgi:uncharacterized membrane protein YidH (DUF202 family)
MTTRPALAAVTGSLCFLPFIAANAIVGNRIEPFFSIIRPGAHTSPREYVLLFVVLLLILVGAAVAARPMLRREVDGHRRFYPVNAVVAVLLCVVFVSLSVGLGSDIYRCDVLGIPNCD